MAIDIAEPATAVIASHLNVAPETLTRDTPLDELGVNSLQLTEIVMDLEDMFDIHIDTNAAEAWASMKTVGNIIDAVEALTKAKS